MASGKSPSAHAGAAAAVLACQMLVQIEAVRVQRQPVGKVLPVEGMVLLEAAPRPGHRRLMLYIQTQEASEGGPSDSDGAARGTEVSGTCPHC